MSRCGWLRRHKYAIQDTKVGDAMMPGLVEEHGTHPKYTLGRYTEFLLRCERCGHIKVAPLPPTPAAFAPPPAHLMIS